MPENILDRFRPQVAQWFRDVFAAPTAVQAQEPWQVKQAWVSAHESFLAGEALQGRGSATRDEAIAAAREQAGLGPVPDATASDPDGPRGAGPAVRGARRSTLRGRSTHEC